MQSSVLEYLEASAREFPDKIAITDEFSSITYAAFVNRVRRVATALAGRGGFKGRPVAVYMEKRIDAVGSFFAAVYAGCGYSFLNPELPDSRLCGIVAVLRPGVILTDREHASRAGELFEGQTVLCFEELAQEPSDETRLQALRSQSIDTDPLYINFTSGSTGVPKGIVVSHRSVIDFIDVFTQLFSICESDILANQAPLDFDVSVKDIYSAVKTGATLALIPRHLFSEPVRLIDFLCEKKVTTMIWAVSALCLISAFHALDYRVPTTVKRILFSGEVMPQKALADFRRHLPDAMYVNLYGPTEITCNCTYHILDSQRDYSDGIPIGRPFPNESVFLIDADNRRVERPGEIGEVCVRGTALALGYFGSEEQNRKHFVQNPLNSDYPERIYKTGDLARYNETGELFFCGRKDFQIKYMGHRIELEEIEREIGKIDGVERCCCLFDDVKKRLKGFYVGSIEKAEVAAKAREKLPTFMVPGVLRRVESMPLTKNGKVDRKALNSMTGGAK